MTDYNLKWELLYSFLGNYLTCCKQCIWLMFRHHSSLQKHSKKPNTSVYIFSSPNQHFSFPTSAFPQIFSMVHIKILYLPLKDLKSTQFKSLSWTSFFFCQESGVSFLAANNYSIPADKEVNLCCCPFRFVFKNSMGTSGENSPFSLSLEFPQFRHQFVFNILHFWSFFSPTWKSSAVHRKILPDIFHSTSFVLRVSDLLLSYPNQAILHGEFTQL